MDLNLPFTPSSPFQDDYPSLPGVFPENPPLKPPGGFSLDLEAPPPPPPNVNGFFYRLLHSHNPDILNDDHGLTVEGSSSDPFSQVVSAPQLDLPFHHPSPDPHPTATFPRGFDLSAPPPPPTPPPPPPPPPPSVDTSLESSYDSNGVVGHGQLEFKSLFDHGPVDHHPSHDPVTVDRQIMPWFDLNYPGWLNEGLREDFSSSGVSSDHQWGREQDNGGVDRSKREVVIALPKQQKPTKGRKKRVNENDKEPFIVKGQWTPAEDE